MSSIRTYEVAARSTDVFGRVLASARSHHLVVDGPVQNGAPGEALTPAELFLAGVATCAAELIGVIAREREIPLRASRATIRGMIDRERQPRADVTLFTEVALSIELDGVDDATATELVEAFKGR